jgi:hypothetical protein
MTIQPADLVLLESERMTDEASGGGRPTGRVIPDNTLNAIFQKTSRRDRTEGRSNLTKVFCAVRTATAESYQGSHFAVTRDAEDAHINVVCLPGTPTDTRAEARARIEAYLVPGVFSNLYLLGDQYAGQRTILLYQETKEQLPELGSTLFLKQLDKTGAVVATDYVKIKSYDAEIRQFTYEKNNEFFTITRRQLTVKLAGKLRINLTGGIPYPTGTLASGDIPAAKVYFTNVADTAQFYGVSALAQSAVAGSASVRVKDVYKPIVPSAYSETNVIEQQALSDLAQLAASGPATSAALTFAVVAGNQSRAFMPRIPMRGSVLTIDSGVYKDDGSGSFKFVSGADNFSQISLSYESGQIDAYRKTSVFTSGAQIAYTPAARMIGAAVSVEKEVTVANRTFSWNWSYPNNPPEAGSVVIWYRSLGKWQLIQDDGTGRLTGAGTGTVTASGTISATFSSLPDAETSIVLMFLPIGALEYTPLAGAITVAKKQVLALPYVPQPGTLAITWTSGGQSKTVTDNGSGVLAGDLTGAGSVSYAGKSATFVPTGLPDDGVYHVAYTRGPYRLANVTIPADAATMATFSAGAPLSPGKTLVRYPLRRRTSTGSPETVTITLTDDGTGKLLRDGVQVGTIDYAAGTGSFSWAKEYTYTVTSYVFNGLAMQKQKETITATELNGGAGTLEGLPSNEAAGVAENITVNMPELSFSLAAPNLVSGSLMFTDGGNIYIERDGILWKNPDSRTGAGSRVGRVELAASRVVISDAKGITGNILINAGVALVSRPYLSSAVWKTPGAPLKSGGLEIKGTTADGSTMTSSDSGTGTLAGALGSGQADISMGLISMQFSKPIEAGSLAYSTVILTAIPLDSDAIGIDPVRLPPDGKVPIYQDGVGVVIGHTATLDIGTPTANQVIDCGRDYLAEVWITDSAGSKLAVNQYAENRDTGLVTMASPLSLITAAGAALVPPLTLHHRIEHRSLVQDVQPNGDLTLAIPLAQDYPAGTSYVSSYIPQGDRYASCGDLFTQQSWDANNPNWTHSPVGPELLADYNIIDYPIEVSNQSTVDDEWLIKFSSQTTFDVVSRDRGLIASGNTTTDLMPINPNTGTPYFILRKGGWSAGWATGNVVRWPTRSALAPVWLLRCVSIGVATHPDDRFEYMQYGDAD